MTRWLRALFAVGLALISRGPARQAAMPLRWLWRVTVDGGRTWRYEPCR
jgi:hypothetical protein